MQPKLLCSDVINYLGDIDLSDVKTAIQSHLNEEIGETDIESSCLRVYLWKQIVVTNHVIIPSAQGVQGFVVGFSIYAYIILICWNNYRTKGKLQLNQW